MHSLALPAQLGVTDQSPKRFAGVHNPVFSRERRMNRTKTATASLEEHEFLACIEIVPPVRGFGDLLINQRAVSRVVGEESKNVFYLFVGSHASIIVYICLLYKRFAQNRMWSAELQPASHPMGLRWAQFFKRNNSNATYIAGGCSRPRAITLSFPTVARTPLDAVVMPMGSGAFPIPSIPSAVGWALARAGFSFLRTRPTVTSTPRAASQTRHVRTRCLRQWAPLRTGQVNDFGQARKKESRELSFPEGEGRWPAT